MKALNLLKKPMKSSEIAENYISSTKRNLQTKIIDSLVKKIEKYDDDILSLEMMDVETNKNANKFGITRDECEARFEKILQLSYERELVAKELEVKEVLFKEYFDEEKSAEEAKPE